MRGEDCLPLSCKWIRRRLISNCAYLTEKNSAAIARAERDELLTTRQRISFWLTLALRPHTMFHRPSKNQFGVLFQLDFLEGRPSLITIGPS